MSATRTPSLSLSNLRPRFQKPLQTRQLSPLYSSLSRRNLLLLNSQSPTMTQENTQRRRLFATTKEISQEIISSDFKPWSEFAQNVSGEWDGFGADFTLKGEPLELPESVVPEAYREWEVRVFDWQTQCPTLAQTNPRTFFYKSIKLLPTVGCEADAATRYTIDQRNITTTKSFCYSVTGSYVAVWPLGDNKLELEYCLIDPNDKESRVRVFQIVRLEDSKMMLESVKVFCELWYGPFRDGDQLGGCSIRNSAFATTPITTASVVAGLWRGVLATTSFSCENVQEGGSSIQQVTGEKVIEIVREEKDLLLLPKGLWCSLKESEDGGESVFSIGWLFEPGHAISSSCVFSCDFKLKEVTMRRETAAPSDV